MVMMMKTIGCLFAIRQGVCYCFHHNRCRPQRILGCHTNRCDREKCEIVKTCQSNERFVPADPSSGKCCATCEDDTDGVCKDVTCPTVTCNQNERTLKAEDSSGACCDSCIPRCDLWGSTV